MSCKKSIGCQTRALQNVDPVVKEHGTITDDPEFNVADQLSQVQQLRGIARTLLKDTRIAYMMLVHV